MRAWKTAWLGLAAALCVLAPASPAHAAGVPMLGYAAILHNKDAPAGRKFSVQLFTKYAHQKKGDAVYVRARRPHDNVYAHEHGKNHGWDVWHITRKRRDGRLLIKELRRQMSHKGRARFEGTLALNNALSSCPVRFKILKYNTPFAGRPLICAQ